MARTPNHHQICSKLSASSTITILILLSVYLLLSAYSSILRTSSSHPITADLGYGDDAVGRRSVLALKYDPWKPKVDQLRKQAEDHKSLVMAYASYGRKLKLENSKLVRQFADLSRNYTDLVNNSVYRAMFEGDGGGEYVVDEDLLRRFEKEVKERIKVTRQLIAEAKESFDNQLKIQKLKDTIFAVNEQLSKAKKQGAFSSLIHVKLKLLDTIQTPKGRRENEHDV